MPATVAEIHGRRSGLYSLLELCLPLRPTQTVGVIVADPATDRAWIRVRSHFDDIADPEDAEVLDAIGADLREAVGRMGAAALLAELEDTLSNAVRITDPEAVSVDSFTRALETLFAERVEPVKVRPYVTHLPLFSMRAAAGFVGEEMRPEEEDWVEAPEGMRLDPDLIAIHVVGRSMEPRIPDGSLNIFRLNPVGSRQGKILLIQRRGMFDDTAGCTVKRYTSIKVPSEDGRWRHDQIRLEPLNREFEAWDVAPDGFSVVAEWVRVLD